MARNESPSQPSSSSAGQTVQNGVPKQIKISVKGTVLLLLFQIRIFAIFRCYPQHLLQSSLQNSTLRVVS